MLDSTIPFTCNQDTFTKKQLNLAKDFSLLTSLTFSSTSLEKKVRSKVKRAEASYSKNWFDFLLHQSHKTCYLDTLTLDFINPLVGFGVFAGQTIQKFGYIGEYLGVVRRRKFFFNSDSDYVFGYLIAGKLGAWVIDAKDSGNVTRFINHSYEPNAICSSWIEGGISHIGFFANRCIKKGEQITFDYGPSYWKKRPFPQTL